MTGARTTCCVRKTDLGREIRVTTDREDPAAPAQAIRVLAVQDTKVEVLFLATRVSRWFTKEEVRARWARLDQYVPERARET